MALTKIGKEGITGISNSADATFLTATSSEGVTLAGTLAVTGVHTVGTNAVATSDGLLEVRVQHRQVFSKGWRNILYCKKMQVQTRHITVLIILQ